ncbi:MAG TPA: hypothetical protein VIJ07_06465 [Dermatophilaceae bacterium]
MTASAEERHAKGRIETPRYRICAVAAKLVRTGRSWQLQLDRDWPWAQHLQDAFNRLRAAPWPA